MLAIRMQRTGRKGYASFRVIVQDSRFAPTSGRVVAKLGHFNPHTKETVIDAEKAGQYLANGAQPSPRAVKLFKENKIKLPDWVKEPDTSKKKTAKNPEKLRKNQPAEPDVVEESSVEAENTVAATEDAPKDEAPKPEVGEPTEAEGNDDKVAEVPKEETTTPAAEEDDKSEPAEDKPEVAA